MADLTYTVGDMPPNTATDDPELYAVLQQALVQLGNRHWLYKRYEAYYNGEHRLVFATEKFRNAFGRLFREFADNLCPAVVDAVGDRLTLAGFTVEEAETDTKHEGPSPETVKIDAQVKDLSEYSRLDRLTGEVHLEALTAGDAYVVIWPDKQNQPRFYPQKAANFTVCYDEEDPTELMWAAKAWRLRSGRFRLTLYLPDRILKYVTKDKCDGLPEKPDKFMPFTPQDGSGGPEVQNPYGRVPVFHFSNNGAVGMLGKSELKDVLPLQDALNKSVLDMMVAMEFVALPQRWATGLENAIDPRTGEPTQPFEPGVDRFWSVPGKDVTFGQYDGADLTGFMKAQDQFRLEICRVSGVPLHYFSLHTGNPPSGEALEALEQRLIKKCLDRHVTFGDTWEDAMQFALLILGQKDVDLCARWIDPRPKSEKEHTEALVNKQTLGVSQRQLWREMDYTDEEIEKMEEEKAEAIEKQQQLFDQGAGVPPQGGRNSGQPNNATAGAGQGSAGQGPGAGGPAAG